MRMYFYYLRMESYILNLKPLKAILAMVVVLLSGNAAAATAYVKETADQVRFEQYVGDGAPLILWRLPSPGSSTFPGSACTSLSVAPVRTEQTSRFFAVYMSAQSNAKSFFYIYDTSACSIVSFGFED